MGFLILLVLAGLTYYLYNKRQERANALASAPGKGTQAATRKSNLKISQDRFKNQTTASTYEASLGALGKTLKMTLTYDQDSDAFEAGRLPAEVFFIFSTQTSMAYGWQYLHYHDIYLLADGAPVEMVHKTDHSTRTGVGLLNEWMVARIQAEKLIALSYAKKIELKLGTNEFTLKADAVARIQDMADYLEDLQEATGVVQAASPEPTVAPENHATS